MNLQDLVPPLELCKQIPKGEFEDSAFYWFADLMQINKTTPHEYKYTVHEADYKGYNWGGFRCFPAPTLQEILEDLPWDFEFSRCYEDNVPTEKYITIIGTEIGEVGDSGVKSTMKTWLNIKGINKK